MSQRRRRRCRGPERGSGRESHEDARGGRGNGAARHRRATSVSIAAETSVAAIVGLAGEGQEGSRHGDSDGAVVAGARRGARGAQRTRTRTNESFWGPWARAGRGQRRRRGEEAPGAPWRRRWCRRCWQVRYCSVLLPSSWRAHDAWSNVPIQGAGAMWCGPQAWLPSGDQVCGSQLQWWEI